VLYNLVYNGFFNAHSCFVVSSLVFCLINCVVNGLNHCITILFIYEASSKLIRVSDYSASLYDNFLVDRVFNDF
jgi:hypothetical protein